MMRRIDYLGADAVLSPSNGLVIQGGDGLLVECE